MLSLIQTLAALLKTNNISKYCLNDTLNLFFGDNNDENIFINDINSHSYYDVNNLHSTLSKRNTYFFSVNLCSLMSKHNDLSNIIVNLTNHNINIAAIAVHCTRGMGSKIS